MTTSTILPTQVTFTQGVHQLLSRVQYSRQHDDCTLVVTEATPFHPASHIWPDHPADKGTLSIATTHYEIINCLTGAWDCSNQQLYVGTDIPVKRGEPGWHFVVVHQLPAGVKLTYGSEVTLSVDATYQQALSRGHSGAHLAAMALNKVLQQDFWRKAATRLDALQHYDFHGYAEETSFVAEDTCVDIYRMGKTLKKRGFNKDDFLSALPQVQARVNAQLDYWRASGVTISMAREGDNLTDSRYWSCIIDDTKVCMPCGGTHVQSMADFSSLAIELRLNDQGNVEMVTTTQG